MGQYYYTVASLPMLAFEAERFPHIDEFLDLCNRTMSDRDFEILRRALLLPTPDETSHNALLQKWYELEVGLRNELVRQRAAQLNRDEQRYLRRSAGGNDYRGGLGIADVARDAISQETPLKSEMVLIRHRWTVLEELEAAHHFDLEALIVYYLKLQLLWRKQTINREDGTNVFERTYETVRAAVSST